jgi:hypothetical protein
MHTKIVYNYLFLMRRCRILVIVRFMNSMSDIPRGDAYNGFGVKEKSCGLFLIITFVAMVLQQDKKKLTGAITVHRH